MGEGRETKEECQVWPLSVPVYSHRQKKNVTGTSLLQAKSLCCEGEQGAIRAAIRPRQLRFLAKASSPAAGSARLERQHLVAGGISRGQPCSKRIRIRECLFLPPENSVHYRGYSGRGGGAHPSQVHDYVDLPAPVFKRYTSINFALDVGIINHYALAQQSRSQSFFLSTLAFPPSPPLMAPSTISEHAKLKFRTRTT